MENQLIRAATIAGFTFALDHDGELFDSDVDAAITEFVRSNGVDAQNESEIDSAFWRGVNALALQHSAMLSVREVAELKGVSQRAVHDVLSDASARAQKFPGAWKETGLRGAWRIPAVEASKWEPRNYPRKQK